MKRIVVLILITVCLLLASCQKSPELISPELSDIELGSTEYDRVGEGRITLRVPALIPLNKAFEQAEMVVKVQITDLYGAYNYKSSDSLGVTVFSAMVVDTYNDCDTNAGEMILIKQFGTSGATVMGCPLYKIGDIFLVCLEKEDVTIYEDNYPEETYRIINELHGVLQEITVDGQKYLINRAHTGFCDEITGSKVDESDRDLVIQALYDYDAVLKTNNYCLFEIYDSEVVIDYLEGLK